MPLFFFSADPFSIYLLIFVDRPLKKMHAHPRGLNYYIGIFIKKLSCFLSIQKKCFPMYSCFCDSDNLFQETGGLSGLPDHGFPDYRNFRAFNILVESHELIDDAAGGDFDNPICHGIHELVVMGGKKNHILEVEQAVI